MPELLKSLFYFPKTYGSVEKLETDIEALKTFFNEYGEKILVEIEKLSGFSWTKERIPVYLIPNSKFGPPYSFSKWGVDGDLPGVVQKLGTTSQAFTDYWILIHELVHTNQRQSDFMEKYQFLKNGDRNQDLLELGADLITLYVLRSLFGQGTKYEVDLWNFFVNTTNNSEKNIRKGAILKKYVDEWDLNKNTLRYYLENNETIIENLL